MTDTRMEMTNLTLRQYTDYIERRNHDDNDSVILVTGYEGTGKSTIAGIMAHRLDPEFTMDKVIFYNINAWWEQINDETWYRSLWLDEALDFLLSYEWGSKQSKSIIKEIAFCRYKRKYIILCLPNIGWLNVYLREHRVKFWVYVKKRGVAELHIGVPQKWGKEIWWEQVGTTRYPDFPDHVKEPYLRRKKEEKDWFLKHGGTITIDTIVNMLNDGVFDSVVNEDMPQREIEDMLHMTLQKDLPYSQFRAGDITRAVRIWLT